MRKTLQDLLCIVGQLREFRALFIVCTAVIVLHQLALAGVGGLSYWISSHVVVNPTQPIVWLFTGLITLALVHGLGYLLDAWWSHQLAYQVLASMRIDLYRVIQRIAPKGLQGRKVADVTAAGMNDMEQLEWFFAHTASVAIAALITPTVLIGVLYALIGPWALLTIVAILFLIGSPLVFSAMQRRQGERVRSGLAVLKTLGLESVIGVRELHVLGQKHKHAQRVDEATKLVQRHKLGQAVRKSAEGALAAVGSTAVAITLLIVLTGKVIEGSLDASLLPVAISLSASITISVTALAGMLGMMGEVSACAARVNSLLQTPDPLNNGDAVEYAPLTELEANTHAANRALDYQNVGFTYDMETVLRDISVIIPPGQTTAIVGPSGAGKTTLAYLAMRFYDPSAGQILFAGVPLTSIDPEVHRERLALVPQDGHVFTGTFRTNLALAKWEAIDAELWEAIDAAGMTKLVTDLGGLDAAIGDRGTSLSGGERQRLVLARAFLRQPELLILDEPLANIDPHLESAINKTTSELRRGCTTIIITHRITSIATADQVVVINQGRIHRIGTHKDLLIDPFYRELLADQFEEQV